MNGLFANHQPTDIRRKGAVPSRPPSRRAFLRDFILCASAFGASSACLADCIERDNFADAYINDLEFSQKIYKVGSDFECTFTILSAQEDEQHTPLSLRIKDAQHGVWYTSVRWIALKGRAKYRAEIRAECKFVGESVAIVETRLERRAVSFLVES